MPRFKVTYIIDASNSYNAHRALTPGPVARTDPNIRMVGIKVTKVRKPYGKRKVYQIVRSDGQLGMIDGITYIKKKVRELNKPSRGDKFTYGYSEFKS